MINKMEMIILIIIGFFFGIILLFSGVMFIINSFGFTKEFWEMTVLGSLLGITMILLGLLCLYATYKELCLQNLI